MSIYSAGLMSQSFWFIEFKKVVKLISEGKSLSQVKDISIEENLFGAANAYRARRIAGYLVNRASTLDQTEVRLFAESDVATQKLLNIIAILRTDRLFFEFLFEVYREKVILGIPTILMSSLPPLTPNVTSFLTLQRTMSLLKSSLQAISLRFLTAPFG